MGDFGEGSEGGGPDRYLRGPHSPQWCYFPISVSRPCGGVVPRPREIGMGSPRACADTTGRPVRPEHEGQARAEAFKRACQALLPGRLTACWSCLLCVLCNKWRLLYQLAWHETLLVRRCLGRWKDTWARFVRPPLQDNTRRASASKLRWLCSAQSC